jgi:hypothetical protein
MRFLLIAMACAVGCGGSNGSDPLAGTAWTARVPGLLCDHQTTFYPDGRALDTYLCMLGDGSQAAEVNRGTYSIEDRTVTVGVSESSCAKADAHSFGFAVNGDSLVLTTDSSVVTMSRLIFIPGEPKVPLGCFDAVDWAFTPMAVHSL